MTQLRYMAAKTVNHGRGKPAKTTIASRRIGELLTCGWTKARESLAWVLCFAALFLLFGPVTLQAQNSGDPDLYTLAVQQCWADFFTNTSACTLEALNGSACVSEYLPIRDSCLAVAQSLPPSPPAPPPVPPPPIGLCSSVMTANLEVPKWVERLKFARYLYQSSGGSSGYGTSSPCVVLIDPVPDLVNQAGNGIVTDPERLAAGGVAVSGITADGAARLVIRIYASFAGERFTLALQSGDPPGSGGQSNPNNLPNPYGLLDTAAGGAAGLQVQVVASDTSQGPMAFAQYFPPPDFSRGGADDNAPSRNVVLQVTSSDDSQNFPNTNITIWRPPVVLVHGLWARPSTWNHFTPLVDPSDPRQFFVGRANYNQNFAAGEISDSVPAYSPSRLNKSNTAALGFDFNAPTVLEQIQDAIAEFKAKKSAAAVQADVVAHSMGGDVTRTLENLPLFTIWTSFNKGEIHKLITIGTPHLGTPLAIQLLDDRNSCVRGLLASRHNLSFLTATVDNVQVAGGVGDLQGEGSGAGTLSSALAAIQGTNGHEVPTAMIAGQMDDKNLSGLTFSPVALGVRAGCLIQEDPLAQSMTASGWPTIFNGQPSDGMVPESSQINGLSGFIKPEVVHSTSLEKLGFNGPSELDSGDQTNIPPLVIQLLNAPTNSSGFFQLP